VESKREEVVGAAGKQSELVSPREAAETQTGGGYRSALGRKPAVNRLKSKPSYPLGSFDCEPIRPGIALAWDHMLAGRTRNKYFSATPADSVNATKAAGDQPNELAVVRNENMAASIACGSHGANLPIRGPSGKRCGHFGSGHSGVVLFSVRRGWGELHRRGINHVSLRIGNGSPPASNADKQADDTRT
jgi:hypothetical protein